MLSSIPALCPLVPVVSPLGMTTESVSRCCKYSSGGTITPSREPLDHAIQRMALRLNVLSVLLKENEQTFVEH